MEMVPIFGFQFNFGFWSWLTKPNRKPNFLFIFILFVIYFYIFLSFIPKNVWSVYPSKKCVLILPFSPSLQLQQTKKMRCSSVLSPLKNVCFYLTLHPMLTTNQQTKKNRKLERIQRNPNLKKRGRSSRFWV